MDLIKKYWYVLFALILIVAAILWIRGDGCGKVGNYFAGDVDVTNPPAPEKVGIPTDTVPVPMIEDRYTVAERLNPLHIKTTAEELTEDLLPGTEVYQVAGEGLIYRTEDGYIYATEDLDITAYKKPYPSIAAEFRPKVIATTDFSNIGIGVEVDLVRAWDIHAGPAGGYNGALWGGGGIGYNVLKNVDVGGYGGYSTDGATYGILVGIAIE